MSCEARKITLSQLYKESNLMYIRYNATIEDKPNGQKKIGGTRPAYSKIEEQVDYKAGAGKYYSLLMGREIKKDQYVMLLDFDNKAETNSKNGLELVQLLNLDQYKAPKQATPSGGLHYLFYVDGEQAKHI